MKRLLTMCAALAVMGVASVSAQADFLSPEYTGNAYFSNGSTQAVVSAAVFENTYPTEFTSLYGTEAGTASFGSPNGGLDEATYIYMFQVVAVSPTSFIGALEVQIPALSAVKSVGYLPGYVLTNNGLLVGTDVDGLGTVDTGTNAFQTTGASVGITDDTNAASLDYAGYTIDSGPMGEHVVFTLGNSDSPPQSGSGLLAGQYSPVLFFTSNIAPTYGMAYAGTANGGQGDSIGITTTPTPVPAGLALLFTGLPGVLGLCFWRRKQEVAA
ncbi:hypothetical protein [Blastopirellula marina]|uniref:PEP-CTERM protein-sorting domain-containing protein n=1 Tax=Blastopirellula marina TaxID=124 RepID=A0A2S8G1C0_9BACT|nr:hypothetical protein [Blastopirellula marina]PQO38061.1 hypothetical protein C5Y98_08225 [Blastopirellula marina]PTL44717.1 hypothetical protein C5Y97_08225 [Blastopirellula marina]